MAERTTEFLFFKKLAQKRLCMDSYYAELFATALTCQCPSDGGDGDGIDNDEKVGVTSNDTNPSYLANKITNCGAIDLIVQNPGGDESLCIGHADTSQSPDIDTTGPQVIDTMIIDDYGHIVSWTLRDLTSGDILDEENLNNIFQDTTSIDFTVSGTTVTADVVLSQQPSNDLQILPDGLFYNDLKGENELVYGGVVTWLQDYDFHVSAAGYYINGIFYEAPEVYITLSPSDLTLDRIDVFYADTTSTIQVLEGTPTEAAAQPGLDLGTQIGLGVVLVQAGSTEPVDIVEECIYQENSEWTTATNSPSTIDVASATTPCDGAITVQATSAVTGNYVDFTRGTSFNVLVTMNVITMLIRPGVGWNTNAVLNHIILSFRLGGVLVKNQLIIDGLNELGLDISDPNCQIVSIPLSSFGLTPTDVVDGFRIEVVAGNSPFSFQVDGLCLQGNLNNSFTDDDIHNQYFGPQTPGRFWIKNNAKVEGWITSPDKVNNLGEAGGSEKFGWGSQAIGTTSTAIGFLAIANGQEGSTAVGNQARADVGVAIGFGAYANRSVAIGGSSTGSGGTVVGGGATGTALSIVAIGGNASVQGNSAIAIGYGSYAAGGAGIAVGGGAGADFTYSAAIGYGAETTAAHQFVIGGLIDIFTDTGYRDLYFGGGVTSLFNANRLWTISGSEGTNTAGDTLTIAGAKGTGTGDSGPISFKTSIPTVSGTTLQSLSEKLGINSNTKGVFVTDSRFQEIEGSDIVAANDLTLGTGNAFTITGNTQVNAITHTNWQDGATVKLHLTGTPTLKHNTAGGANTSPLRLAGAVDFTVSGYTVLELQLKDGYWNEVGRTVATGGGSGILTADNALNLSSATNVQWGGPLVIPQTLISFGTNEEVLWQRDVNNYMSWYGDAATWYWNSQFQEDYGKINIDAGGFNYTITTFNSLVQSGQMDFDYAGNLTKTGVSTSITDSDEISLYSDGGSNYSWLDVDHSAASNKYLLEAQSTNLYSQIKHVEFGTPVKIEAYNSGSRLELNSDEFMVFDVSGGLGAYFYGRFGEGQGSDIASANDLTLGQGGNTFIVTGTTQINTITNTYWNPGAVIRLIFSGALTLKHNQAPGVNTSAIILQGATDWTTSANSSITLVLRNVVGLTTWVEASRSTNASGGSGILTADNGLTKDTATNVQWGGLLIKDTYVEPAGYNISLADGTIFDAGDSSCFAVGRNHSSEAGGGDLNFAFQNNQNIGGNENTAFGRNHIVRGNGNFIAGADGSHKTSANYAFSAGDALDNWGIAAALFGFGNDNYIENALVGGSDNVVGHTSSNGLGTGNTYSNTFVYGLTNIVNGSRSFVGGQSIIATGNNITAFGKSYTITTADSFNVGYDSNIDFQITDDKVRINQAMFQTYQGTGVTAATDITLPTDGNVFAINGSTTIHDISSTNWQAGSVIILLFQAAVTVKHNTGPNLGYSLILLAGGIDLLADAGTVLQLVFNGNEWEEIGRKSETAGSTGILSANNGLSLSSPTNVQLFGPVGTPATLLNDRYLTEGAFNLNITGTSGFASLYVANTGFGFGLSVSASNTAAISAASAATAGVEADGAVYGVSATSTSGTGISAVAGGLAGFLSLENASTNTVATVLTIDRDLTAGVGAAGIGGSIDFTTKTSTSSDTLSNQIISKWDIATHASRTSQLDITGINSTATGTIASFYGTGVVGIGISSGYTATRLNVVDNSVTSGSIVDITSTSTGAASNTQKVVNISLSGANANSTQSTFGLVVSNSHTGTAATNYGGSFSATGNVDNYAIAAGASGGTRNVGVASNVTGTGNSAAFYGSNAAAGYVAWMQASSTGIGVFAEAASGTGVAATSNSGKAITAVSNGTPTTLEITNGGGGLAQSSVTTYSSTNTVESIATFARSSSGTAADGIGGSIDLHVEAITGGNLVSNQIISKWTTAAFASRTSEFSITGVNSTTTNVLLTISGAGIFTLTQGLSDYADDSAASAGGIPVNGLYRTGSAVKIRVS